MFQYLNRITDKQASPLTEEKFYELIDNEQLAYNVGLGRSCLAEGNTDGYQKAKRLLPSAMWCGYDKTGNGSRKACDLTPTQYYMVDIDKISPSTAPLPSPLHEGEGVVSNEGSGVIQHSPLGGDGGGWDFLRNLVEGWGEELMTSLGIRLVHITPSGRGLRIVARATQGFPTLKEHMDWLVDKLDLRKLGEYDSVCKDFSRQSYLVPRCDFLFISKDLFNEESDHKPIERAYNADSRPVSTHSADADTIVPASVCNNQPTSLSFKGIEYSKIIERLLLAMGVDGKPEEGERNNYLYSLARELRYVTDFNEEKIISVLPDWGLPETEVRRTVASAVGSVRKKDVPQRLQRIIQAIMAEKAQMEDDSEEEEIPEELEIPHRLPRFFQTLIKAYPQEYKAAALLASLPCLGALASRVRSTYLDGSTHSPSFITCIVAPQASGKSFARHEFNLLTEPIKRADVIGREREREYQEKRKAAKNTKNQPEDPKAVIRLIPATASNAMILKRADYARGLHLLTFAEEIDTLTKGNKAGAWSQKSDLYRMAFDNAEWGQDYMSDNSYSGQVQLFYNLLVCGTPNAMSRFFNDVEDGLVSRVCFIKLPDMLGTKMPQFGKYRKGEKDFLSSEITRLNDLGADREDGMAWMAGGKLSIAIESWLDDKRMEYLQTQDNPAMDVFRRRAGVIGYRAGMICWALEGKMTKEGVDFALWVANYVLHNLLDLFGEAMNKAMTETEDKDMGTQTKTSSLFSSLPNVFTKQDIVLVASSFKVVTPARKLVSRWKKAGLVRMVDKNKWEKSN